MAVVLVRIYQALLDHMYFGGWGWITLSKNKNKLIPPSLPITGKFVSPSKAPFVRWYG